MGYGAYQTFWEDLRTRCFADTHCGLIEPFAWHVTEGGGLA